jgi:F-type H+-transporting ATPase subunit b
MLINWFTVAAQAINFLILVWLLQHFLYKPILSAIDAREKGIADQLKDAQAKQAEAEREQKDFQKKNQDFDQERAALLKKANEDASAQREQILSDAKKDADALRAKRQAALDTEQRNLGDEITRWVQKEVFAVTRKTLADLASTSLEERMGDVLVRRVRALDGTDKEQLTTAFKTGNHTVSVHSAFDLPQTQKTAIESAVKETFAPDARVQFETAPELVSGIELATNGHKVSWSIADYLATLKKSAGELVHKDSKPKADAKPEPNADAKPEPKADAKLEPKADVKPPAKRDSKNGPVPVASAPKAEH